MTSPPPPLCYSSYSFGARRHRPGQHSDDVIVAAQKEAFHSSSSSRRRRRRRKGKHHHLQRMREILSRSGIKMDWTPKTSMICLGFWQRAFTYTYDSLVKTSSSPSLSFSLSGSLHKLLWWILEMYEPSSAALFF